MKKKIIIAAFFLFLALPNLVYPAVRGYIDSENHENRTYAEFPEVSLEKISEFPQGVEDYYNDRLPFKNQLKRLNSLAENTLSAYESNFMVRNGIQPVTAGKDGWLYYTIAVEGENAIADYVGTNLYTEDQLKTIADMYQEVNAYFRGNGQEYLLFIPPNKEQVYAEYMPSNIRRDTDKCRTERAVEYLQETTDVQVIYLKDIFLQSKDSYPLYFKSDTHWNDIGAFIGAQAINRQLQGIASGLDDVEITPAANRAGDLSKYLGIQDDYTDDIDYQIEGYSPGVTVQLAEAEPDEAYYHYTSDAPDQRNVLMLRDSFGLAMMKYLAASYADVKVVNSAERAKEIIEKEKPDIIIEEIIER